MKRMLWMCAGWVMLAKAAAAQGPAPQPGITPGPWDNDVQLFRAWPDGSRETLGVFPRAGVPSLVRLADGRLMAAHQWFPENDADAFDKIAVRFSEDAGQSWTDPRVIELDALAAGQRFPFDPTLLQLPDGRIRLYFTTLRGRTFEQDTPSIGSAISSDGVHFTLEAGQRLAVAGQPVIDCAAVLHAGVFHLYSPIQSPEGGAAYHATSPDGLDFTRQADVTLPGVRWLGAALSSGAAIHFYGTRDGGLWRGASADGQSWSVIEAISLQGADPGVVELLDGSRLFLVTGPPRPGTPSAHPMALRRPLSLH